MAFATKVKNYLRRRLYSWLNHIDDVREPDIRAMQKAIAELKNPPVFSIVMPTYNSHIGWLNAAIESVQRQIYPHWELCIADDASTQKEVIEVLRNYAAEDGRIKIILRDRNGHISACSNSALTLATGDFMVLLDHDDTLPPQALFKLSEAIQRHSNVEMIYTDEDKIAGAENAYLGAPYFKTEWDLDLFLGHNMFNHLGCFKLSTVKAIGGFREGFEGSQDYDITLRMIDAVGETNIHHIPEILYHWRAAEGSAAAEMDAKPYAINAARQTIQEFLNKKYPNAIVKPHAEPAFHQIIFPLPENLPLVSIIIWGQNHSEQRQRLVASIAAKTNYKNIEILHSHDLRNINTTIAEAKGEVIFLLHEAMCFTDDKQENNTNRCAIGELVAMALREDVGAISPKLAQADGLLQTTGFLLNRHPFKAVARAHNGIRAKEDFGYFGRARTTHGASILPLEAMIFRKKVWEDCLRLNAMHYSEYMHIDFCLRLKERGYKCLSHGTVALTSHKPILQGERLRISELLRLKLSFRNTREPFYSPNLNRYRYNYCPTWRLPI